MYIFLTCIHFNRFTAVRLGRCPKKDKPKRSNFFKLPQNQNGAVDVDKQIRTEQMVLTIHDAFRAARKDFDIFSHQFAHEQVCYI